MKEKRLGFNMKIKKTLGQWCNKLNKISIINRGIVILRPFLTGHVRWEERKNWWEIHEKNPSYIYIYIKLSKGIIGNFRQGKIEEHKSFL
jgi:hypothetical protein